LSFPQRACIGFLFTLAIHVIIKVNTSVLENSFGTSQTHKHASWFETPSLITDSLMLTETSHTNLDANCVSWRGPVHWLTGLWLKHLMRGIKRAWATRLIWRDPIYNGRPWEAAGGCGGRTGK